MTSLDSDLQSELESERRPESESVSVSGSDLASKLEESGSDPGSESDHCSDLGSELGWDDEVESDDEFEPYQPSNAKFQQIFTCYPMSDYKSPHLESGDKIIMPPSALSRIVDLDMQYPLVFKVHSFNNDVVHHCGVLQFDAEEDCVHMPEWMMDNLNILGGDKVVVTNAAVLSKGVYMKLQPHASAFTELDDPRLVLENTLREFTCVGSGSTIMVKHNQVGYYFDVLDVMPPGEAITLTDTDCRVEFAPALDYVEPVVKTRSNGGCLVRKVGRGEKVVEEEVKVFKPFTGNGWRLDGQVVVAAPPTELPEPSKRLDYVEPVVKTRSNGGCLVRKVGRGEKVGEEEVKVFKPFTGNGWRLDGQVVVAAAPAELPEPSKRLDYVEPVVKTRSNGGCLVRKVGRGEKVGEEEVKVFKPFTGNGRRLDGQVVVAAAAAQAELPEPSKRIPGEYEAKGEFKPFTGKSHVLGCL